MARERKGFASMPRWTCWAQDERNHRINSGESLVVTGARHVLYELAAMATPEPGYIPNDDKRLSAVLGITVEEWEEIKPGIVTDWQETPKGWFIRRINAEMKAAETMKKKQSNGGKASARKRQAAKEKGNLVAASLPTSLPASLQPSSEGACNSACNLSSTIPNPESLIPRKREEKQRLPDGPGTPARDPDHRALNSGNPAEAEPEEPPFVVQLWTRDRLGEAGRAANETAETFRVGRASLSNWIVLQRQQCRHPRAVVKALKDAKRIGPSKILNLTGWLNTATKKESPKEFAKDSEAQGVEHRAENAGAAKALFGDKESRR